MYAFFFLLAIQQLAIASYQIARRKKKAYIFQPSSFSLSLSIYASASSISYVPVRIPIVLAVICMLLSSSNLRRKPISLLNSLEPCAYNSTIQQLSLIMIILRNDYQSEINRLHTNTHTPIGYTYMHACMQGCLLFFYVK